MELTPESALVFLEEQKQKIDALLARARARKTKHNQ